MDKKETYKLLIADDEYWVREELLGLLEWDRYRIRTLEPAVDGEEALSKVKELRPDILITDVNMPFLNGVELLKAVKEIAPDTVVIMLSGYNDFEYVKDSLTSGAIDYLMKPISKLELIKVMTKALSVINQGYLEKKEREIEHRKLLRAESSLNDREYSALITHERSMGPNNLFRPMQAGEMSFSENGFSTMLIKIHNINSLAGIFNNDMNLLSYSIKQHIKEQEDLDPIIVFNNIYSTSEFIVVVDQKKEAVKEKAYFLLVSLRKFTERTISIGVSDAHFSESDLYLSYEEAKRALNMREFSEGSVVNVAREVLNDASTEPVYPADMERRFRSVLSAGEEAYRFVLEQLGFGRIMEEGWSISRVTGALKFVFRMTQDAKGIPSGARLEIEQDNLRNSLIHAAENMEYGELLSLLHDYLENLGEGKEPEVPTTGGKQAIVQIKEYIEEHYAEEITLSLLAEKYHMEGTYLSRLFKKETGENLISFISGTRIKKSCKLMEEIPSITEVAFLVGYDDYNYFNKVFRKYMGMSPREYRDSLGK